MDIKSLLIGRFVFNRLFNYLMMYSSQYTIYHQLGRSGTFQSLRFEMDSEMLFSRSLFILFARYKSCRYVVNRASSCDS